MMQGPHQAKALVSRYLGDDLPVRLLRYRNLWEVDDETLPDPAEYLSYEPVALDSWPTIITIAISTNNMVRNDYTGLGDPSYRVSYAMRTYIWARTDGPAETTLMRDRLTTVVRSALLDRPSLAAHDYAEECQAMIDETSMREEFSDLTLLKGDRYLAGAYIGYVIDLDERITRSTMGELGKIDLTVSQLPKTEW